MCQNCKDKSELKIVFMGTPDFALPSLRVIKECAKIVGVVTQPDRTCGRKREIASTPVKKFAVEYGLEIYQPGDVSNTQFTAKIENWKPDLVIVAAYGRKLPAGLLEMLPKRCINLHPSLLPKYRGPCPIERAIMDGETTTGVSCIFLTEKIDSGEIIAQRKVAILPDDTSGILGKKLSEAAAGVIREVVMKFKTGCVKSFPQTEKSSYAPFLKKADAHINWKLSSGEIHNFVRALNPRIGARAKTERVNLIVWETSAVTDAGVSGKVEGEVLGVCRDGLKVMTGSGYVILKIVQPEGGKRQAGADYARGHKISRFV